MKAKSGIILFSLVVAMTLTMTACLSHELETQKTGEGQGASRAVIDRDREGNPIILPKNINRIISMGPSNTEILDALGFAGKIIAADTYSTGVKSLADDIPLFSMMAPDGEQIIDLEPDVIFVTKMSKAGGADPLKAVASVGICVVYIPSSNSVDGIKDDIRFIAEVMGAKAKGNAIIEDMEKEIGAISKTGALITDKKTVYFEIGAAPSMYSFGAGVFLNEMLELVGAKNILAEQESWVLIPDEVIFNKNPDVILTNVNYIDDPIDEIVSRPGWNGITAVKNGDVYYIDTDASSNASHNIVKALKEIAKAVYPDKY